MKYLLILLALIGGIYYGYNFKRVETMADGVVIKSGDSGKTDRFIEIRKIENILKGTPAEKYAGDIWEASYAYRIHPGILLGILHLESSYLRHTPANCFNGTGLGIFKGSRLCFKSYKENIFATAKHWATSSRFRNIKNIVHRGCMWQQGRAVDCPYGQRLERFVSSI